MPFELFTRFRRMAAVGTTMMLLVAASSVMASDPGAIYALKIDGLACPFCAYGVEKKLLALDGVESIKIDIDRGLVTVTLKEGATFDEKIATKAVDEAGFTLRHFEAVK